MADKKEKRYVSDNAQLMAEWNWERNMNFSPSKIGLASHKKAWWKCSKGHEWEAIIGNRAKGRGCPYCAGQIVVVGANDLQTVNPALAKEWDYEKNDDLTPKDVLPNSNIKVWWKCGKGHEWQSTINNRSNGNGCPYCAGKKVLKGYNDLQTVNPSLAKEWNYEKNGNLSPDDFTVHSGKKVWWKCEKGHEWLATQNDRSRGRGCPYCGGKKVLYGYNDLQTINPTLSTQWHPTKNTVLDPCNVTANSAKIVWWKCNEGHEWQQRIDSRNKGNGCPYCSGRYAIKNKNDLQTVNPDLAKEWNYIKNGDLKPEDFKPNSNEIVWWKCVKGHEWRSTITNRNKGNRCPYCSGKYPIIGESDLQTVNPTLAKEWHYEKNDGLSPSDVLPNSNKKVWWVCSKGHEWNAVIAHRNNGNGCPICNSERNTSFPEFALAYYLKKLGLEIIQSYRENGYELDIYIPSIKVAIEYDGYYWHKDKTENDLNKNKKCEKDGIRLYRIREGLLPLNDTSIDYIVQKNQIDLPQILEQVLHEITGKSICVDFERDSIAIENLRELIEKEKSILLTKPEIRNEWNYEKNGNLIPENFTANSGKKVWWKCSKGHEWFASIRDKNKGAGCPYCSGHSVLIGYNDLQTVNQALAKEWNYEKNAHLKPTDFTANSGKKVWWKCSQEHEWQATIDNRSKGSGCPYCAGQRIIRGTNDLHTVNPTLAKEWNYEKNNALTPSEVFPNSGKKVWWKCKNGHEWQATIASRNYGRGCPECAKKKKSIITVNL